MARWEPNALERLRNAAMELFGERGYDATTAADIAARADLTERTFFRYFSDKREVLFAEGAVLRKLFVDKLTEAPASMAPLEAAIYALEAAAPIFHERSDFARKRQVLINAHAELHERELQKMAALADAFAETLRTRGAANTDALLAAEMSITIFRIAFQQWVEDAAGEGLDSHIRKVRDAMKASL